MTAIREEDLNMVSGGYISEVVEDSKALDRTMEKFGGQKYDRCKCNTFLATAYWFPVSNEVFHSWRRAGVHYEPCIFEPNKYYRNGKRISRKEALWIIR